MVKRVGVYWNSGKTHGLSVARSVIELAQGSDMEPVLDAALADALGERGGLSVDQMAAECDVIVVLGGDGTRSDAARSSRGVSVHVHAALGKAGRSAGLDLGDGSGVFLAVDNRQRHDRVRRISA